jgi:hypothetical protein
MMSDQEYDQLCKDILENFDVLRVTHRHGYLLDKEALKAGSGYHITPGQYPNIVKHCALQIYEWSQQGRDYLAWLEQQTKGETNDDQ